MTKPWERGSALPLVLWILVVLLIVSLSFSYILQSRIRRMESLFKRFQANLEAYSGLQYGLRLFLTGTRRGTELLTADRQFFPDGNRYWMDGTPTAVPLFEEHPQISFQDYSGLINLRRYNPVLLDGLLKHFGAPELTRRIFIDSLLDWIDPDDLVHLNGAEADYYRPFGYRPRNAPLLTVDEILMIRGMDESLFAKIRPFLVLGNTQGCNYMVAPLEVLLSFPGMTPEAAERIIQLRKTGVIIGMDSLSAMTSTNYSLYEDLFTVTSAPSVILEASSKLGTDNRFILVSHVKKRSGASVSSEEFGQGVSSRDGGSWIPFDITFWREIVR
jgi:general secretion pathway protein K